jgi:para-nitrobenzyl esterase
MSARDVAVQALQWRPLQGRRLSPQVKTNHGCIRGSESSGVCVFRGVPYARPPAGALRFRPPVPPLRWRGVRDATTFGPAAPQYALPWFGWISAAGREHGEDCLSLNVWTPGLDGARRPVLVWIHGGGFMVGAGSTRLYDGADLARRGDAVVVTINYRLGALGYVHLGAVLGDDFEDSTNLGVRDQIAALEWVRDHAERFGGDPGNVTVFGQSAGAMSVGALLGSPRARGLFRRAICQSGAADHVLHPDEARDIARAFLRELGGPPPCHSALGRIDLRHILRAQAATMRRLSGDHRLMVFLPSVDGDVITEQPLEAVRRGATADHALLVGSTLDEWKLFRVIDPGPRGMSEEMLQARFAEALAADFGRAPPPPRAAAEFREAVSERTGRARASEVWSAFQTARIFHQPAARLAEAQAEGGGDVWTYLFTWRPRAARRALGACHALDVPFVFGATRHPLALPLTGPGKGASELSRRMQAAWIAFARHGRPGHDDLPVWQPYAPGWRRTMVFGRDVHVDPAPLEAERSLLESWSTWRAAPRRAAARGAR